MTDALAPTLDADETADLLYSAVDTQEQVLGETFDALDAGSIKESGRTFCPSSDKLKGPVARRGASVDLSTCSVPPTGIIHSHVTRSQLRNPKHSLPDIANVLYGPADASLIVGTETCDLFMEPVDVDYGRYLFDSGVGVSVDSPSDVLEAITDGRVPNPSQARKNVRDILRPLFEVLESPVVGFDHMIDRAPMQATSTQAAATCGCAMVYEAPTGGSTPLSSGIRRRAERASKGNVRALDEGAAQINLGHIVVATIVGDIVSMGLRRAWNK